MTNETENAGAVTTRGPLPASFNPFAKVAPEGVNAGSVAVEEARATAEVQAAIVAAKRFPRDQADAFNRAMDACRRPSLAQVAMYSYPRGSSQISGPSIRLAEELARCWGNIQYGIRELSQRDGVSEMQAFAWDLETNVMSVQNFTVKHERDTGRGKVRLTDNRDVYEITANMGGRRLRARIMAVLPPDLIDAAVSQCRETMAGDASVPLVDRVRKMVSAFDKLGVPASLIEKRLGRPLLEMLPDDFADLTGIYNSVKDGHSKPEEWFNPSGGQGSTEAASKIKAAAGAPATTPEGAAPASAEGGGKSARK